MPQIVSIVPYSKCKLYTVSFFHFDQGIITVLSHSIPQNGSTALMVASGSGHTDVVQLLLSSGAQVDLQDEVRHNINYSETLIKGHSKINNTFVNQDCLICKPSSLFERCTMEILTSMLDNDGKCLF